MAIDPEAAGNVEALAVSFFAVFVGSAGAGGLDSFAAGAGALLAVVAGAGATTVSVLAGFGGAAGFSVVGSSFFSLSGFAGVSDMVMVTT